MFCSNCGRLLKPVVAVDIDGTLGDYHGHFLDFLEAYYYLPTSTRKYFGVPQFSAWCMDTYGITLEDYRQAKLAYRQGGMKRTMPIFVGAQALCWSIRDRQAELWMTTTRPYLSLDGVVPDTVAWLEHHDISYNGLLFDEDKYERLFERIDPERVVAILDDLPEYLRSASRLSSQDIPIQVKHQYNSGDIWPVSASLDACADIVKHRIEDWYAARL